MRQIKPRVLRLKYEAVSVTSALLRPACGLYKGASARTSAWPGSRRYWPLPKGTLDELRLYALAVPGQSATRSQPLPSPITSRVHQELQDQGRHLQLLWAEVRKKRHRRTRRIATASTATTTELWTLGLQAPQHDGQVHRACEKIFIDY